MRFAPGDESANHRDLRRRRVFLVSRVLRISWRSAAAPKCLIRTSKRFMPSLWHGKHDVRLTSGRGGARTNALIT